MQNILDRLEQLDNWKELMRTACRQNGIAATLAADLTILKLRQLEERFSKSSLLATDKITTLWMENELRAFNWLLVAVSALSKTLIKNFGSQEWNALHQIFPSKTLVFLKFEARKLIQSKDNKNKNWTKEEEELLIRQATKFLGENIPWNEVAHRMFESSAETVFRSGKHCREHWLNYLDPNKQRGAWTIEEDLFLLENVSKHGRKWSEIAMPLKRTEHTVKNRFNSLMLKQKKLTPHINKEEKLIKEIRARHMNAIRNSQELQTPKQYHSSHLNHQKQPQQEAEAEDASSQQLPIMDSHIKINPPSQQEPPKSEVVNPSSNEPQNLSPYNQNYIKSDHRQKQINIGEKIEVENPLSNYSPAIIPNCDLNFFIKEEKETKKTVFSEFPIYSPYSPYIISPSTPGSYLNAGPIFVNSPFYNYYNTFMSLTDFPKQDSRQQPPKPPNEAGRPPQDQ